MPPADAAVSQPRARASTILRANAALELTCSSEYAASNSFFTSAKLTPNTFAACSREAPSATIPAMAICRSVRPQASASAAALSACPGKTPNARVVSRVTSPGRRSAPTRFMASASASRAVW